MLSSPTVPGAETRRMMPRSCTCVDLADLLVVGMGSSEYAEEGD